MEKLPKHEEATCPYCKQEIVINAENKLVSHNNPEKFKIPDDLTIYKPEKCIGSGYLVLPDIKTTEKEKILDLSKCVIDDGDCVSGNCDECPISGKSRECEKKQVKSNETTWITRSEVRDIELFLSLLVEKGTIPLTERHFYKGLEILKLDRTKPVKLDPRKYIGHLTPDSIIQRKKPDENWVNSGDIIPIGDSSHVNNPASNLVKFYEETSKKVREVFLKECDHSWEKHGDEYDINDVEYQWYKCSKCGQKKKEVIYEPEN